MTARRPRLAVPAGACDTHMHVYDAAVPSAPGGPALPGHFPATRYRELQARLGLERVIVVQPNAYQDDHRVTLAAIRALGAGARGVGAVKPGVADAEIERLTRGGIVAQRIFNLPNGAVPIAQMDDVMARVHAFGWHANIQLDGRELPRYEAQIKRLPGKFVIDHTGKYLEPVAPDDDAFKALLRLVDSGRCWVKLSAPYETSRTGAPRYEDVTRLAKALVRHAPERMLWASNWPHPSAPPDAVPDDADLLDLLADWAPDEGARRRILVDNPAELYGFGSGKMAQDFFVAVGETAEFSKTLTAADVDRFAELSGDFDPIHVDEAHARTTPFGRRIAHGILSMAILSTVSAMMSARARERGSRGTSVSMGYDRIRFLKPVFVGETLTARYTVLELDPATRRSRSKVEVVKGDGELVVVGEHIMKWLPEEPAP